MKYNTKEGIYVLGLDKGGGAISFKGVEDRSSGGRANKITLNIPVKASFRYF